MTGAPLTIPIPLDALADWIAENVRPDRRLISTIVQELIGSGAITPKVWLTTEEAAD